jgi:hypothetical protein
LGDLIYSSKYFRKSKYLFLVRNKIISAIKRDEKGLKIFQIN